MGRGEGPGRSGLISELRHALQSSGPVGPEAEPAPGSVERGGYTLCVALWTISTRSCETCLLKADAKQDLSRKVHPGITGESGWGGLGVPALHVGAATMTHALTS